MNEVVSCSAYDSNRNFQTYQPGIGINDVTTNSPEAAQAELNSLFKLPAENLSRFDRSDTHKSHSQYVSGEGNVDQTQ